MAYTLNREKRYSFTLVEIMIVLAISSLVVSMLFGVFTTVSTMYQNSAANLFLMHQARLVRGRLISRAPEFGLIESHANDVEVDADQKTIEYTTVENIDKIFREVSFKTKYDVDDAEKLLILRIEAYHAEDSSDPGNTRISGTTKIVEEVVSFGDGPAGIFDNAYFINNFGWMYGSSLTVNGNMRSNGNLNFKHNPTVNGNATAGNSNSGWNDDISSEGAIIGAPRHDSKSNYNIADIGPGGNSKARYLVTQETLKRTE